MNFKCAARFSLTSKSQYIDNFLREPAAVDFVLYEYYSKAEQCFD